MPNFIERWLPRRTNAAAPENHTSFGNDPAQHLLRSLIPHCAACESSLDSHSYRFIACHPASATDAATFLQAIHAEDWLTVQASQKPALDQPLYILYAISCPHPQGSGMVALLLTLPDLRTSASLVSPGALSPESMAALRAQCPTCQWIPFTAPLQL